MENNSAYTPSHYGNIRTLGVQTIELFHIKFAAQALGTIRIRVYVRKTGENISCLSTFKQQIENPRRAFDF